MWCLYSYLVDVIQKVLFRILGPLKNSSRVTMPLNVRCVVQGSAAASPAAGAGEEAEYGQGPGRIQALLQGEDEALRPGGSTLTSLFLM